MKYLLFVFGMIIAAEVPAQNITTFGSDNSTRCYQESNSPFSDYGLRYCTDAIRNDDLVLRDLAATHTNRGIIYAANGRLDEAMEDHNQALLLSPKMGKIYVNRGNVFHQTHEYEQALADYDKAIELDNVKLDIVYYNKSLTLIRMKRWDDARTALETALEVNPESSRVKRKLAQFDLPIEEPAPAVVTPDDD
ncbi:MAG: tetratricopeptide repeat protein [Gammaproteobacteria bacterium]|jgi:tetratricopeptide (TPR) repeat protein|nr:tetratricopeptide repeat protein [Gammaproteobacteria bacterium]MBT4493213.1 tetratricopeptide repeat protein [Gammaproteobacteria bacterium]MBT7371365.1 tetratricopeptide repeat protein [Gammaproteobacteria bacterium]